MSEFFHIVCSKAETNSTNIRYLFVKEYSLFVKKFDNHIYSLWKVVKTDCDSLLFWQINSCLYFLFKFKVAIKQHVPFSIYHFWESS